jgi:spermidine/putrescine-binding protein
MKDLLPLVHGHFMVNLLKPNVPISSSVIPKEGATGWADTTMVHAEAENLKLCLSMDGASVEF